MGPRRTCVVLALVLLVLTSSSRCAEPDLKPAVRLRMTGSRLQGWIAPEVVDWDNDGLMDVVVGHYSGKLSVYSNRGMGRYGLTFEQVDIPRRDGFASRGQPIWAWRFNKPNCVCPGPGRLSPRVLDWDNDGKKDLVIGDGSGAQTRIWRNIGTDKAPLFSTHHIQYLPPDAGVRPYHETVGPCIADWNGNGKKDLIMGRNRGIYVYINEGTDAEPKFDFDRSRLGTKIRNVFPAVRLSPVFTDWDGDGKKDLVVGSQHGEIWFAKNVGSRTQPMFDGYTRVKAGGEVIRVSSEARIAVADLDGDGHQDLLVGADNGVVWFYQAKHSALLARSRYQPVPRNTSVRAWLVGTDDAGRELTYRVLTQPKHGKLEGTPPKLVYTPNKDYEGEDKFTFEVVAGKIKSAPATMTMEVKGADKPPGIATQPADELVALGQRATFRVVASGKPPFTYQWSRNGKPIPRAVGPSYVIREANADDSGTYSAKVNGPTGVVSSRSATLEVKPTPSETANVPVLAIEYKSPLVEPKTAGVLTLTRTGNTSKPVTVKLASRPGHYPVLADVHYVPVPTSITLKPGQTQADVEVMPIDDTLTGGKHTLTFSIVPNPAYRIAPKRAAAQMIFHDDDCPHVGVRAVRDGKPHATGQRTFEFTALPAPRRDTEITYSVEGTAVAGVDYESLSGTVTIPAGETSAVVVVQPYKQPKPGPKKTVVLTMPVQRFTFFDFYRYLTEGRPRTASVVLTPTDASPAAPDQGNPTGSKPGDAAVENLRSEVSRLGWIVFSARSNGPNSDFDLFAMRPDGSHLRNMTNTPKYDEYSARVSPDGKRMLYRRVPIGRKIGTSDRTEQNVGEKALRTWPPSGNLILANADGSNPEPVDGDASFAWASWGPKGERFACLEQVEAKESGTQRLKASFQIVIRQADTSRIVKTLPSGGIHSHATWSPDGKRICGPANILPGKSRLSKGLEYQLGLGKLVSIDVESGKRIAMARFPDWSPVWASDSDGDWFQGGSPEVLHSANNYGICPAYYSMLWRSGLEEKPSNLVFAEYQKNVWGGCTSPDDKYAIFVIEGDMWPLQGKMAIVRLADAPIARGRSPLFHEVLADLFPKLKKGPVLDLTHIREGFDPHWTRADMGRGADPDK